MHLAMCMHTCTHTHCRNSVITKIEPWWHHSHAWYDTCKFPLCIDSLCPTSSVIIFACSVVHVHGILVFLVDTVWEITVCFIIMYTVMYKIQEIVVTLYIIQMQQYVVVSCVMYLTCRSTPSGASLQQWILEDCIGFCAPLTPKQFTGH